MPHYVDSTLVPAPVEVVFAFLRSPTNWQLLAAPDLHLELLAAPSLLELGSRMKWKGRRWGVAHRSDVEVTAFEMNKLLVTDQRTGPFRLLKQVHRFEPVGDEGTRLGDEVTYEPPGGMLGLLATAAFIQRELTAVITYRNRRLVELLGGSDSLRRPPA